MRRKKLLTLDQLVEFCDNHKFYNFNSSENGHKIYVQVPNTMEFIQDDNEKDFMKEGLMFCPVRVCHTLNNRNNSFISEANMKKALPSLAYRPLLGMIHQLDDGSWDFHSHDMEIVETDDNNYEYEYLESQIGTFTADKPQLVYDKELDKTYLESVVAIPEEYSRAAEIIRRKGGTKVSCELAIDKMSYDAEKKWLVIEDFIFSGVTCLGSEKDGTEIREGMEGSRLAIEDFQNNSLFSEYDNKLIETLAKLNETLSNFNIDQNIQKGGLKMTKFEELLDKYGKSLDDITFDYEGLTDEELEAKFAEAFFDGEDPADPENPDTPGGDTPGGTTPGSDTPGSDTPGSDTPGGTTPATDPTPEPTEADQTAATAAATLISALTDESTELEVAAAREAYDALTDIQKGLISEEVLAVLTGQEYRITEEINLKIDDTETPESKKIAKNSAIPESYSITMSDGTTKTFALSLQDKISALTVLVNETYGEADDCWYDVIVYDKNIVMTDWWSGKAFRQDYKVRSGVYSLVGDRVEVHSIFVTVDEEKALDELKANFASTSEELEKYHEAEERAKKQDVLNSEDYELIVDKNEYKEIDIEKYSLDELKHYLDEILLKYVKEGNLNFAKKSEDSKEPTKKLFGIPTQKKKGRYGSIFKKDK